MSSEAPFFANRRKRAGLVRRIGNLAGNLEAAAADPDLQAMYILATSKTALPVETDHLKHMIASHLEFVSPVTHSQATSIARWAGVAVELINQRNYKDIRQAPENMQAAFVDVAAVFRKSME